MASARYASYIEEEDWDISTLQLVNSHLESYLTMLPGGGTDLTLNELQGLASRQQVAMESQQQALLARETRLKYLQQQEARHRQLAAEQARLHRMRERVEAQELKLKKLRALRGQVEQYKASNGNLSSELEAVRALFNEKEKELAVAVSKVDQLMSQLQELRSTKGKGIITNGNSSKADGAALALELEKLRKELQHRNQFNEQQNLHLSAQRQLLQQRKDEVVKMDTRIRELQQRLKKSRSQQKQQQAQQKQQQQQQNIVVKPNANNVLEQKDVSSGSVQQKKPSPNIAAVEPFIQFSSKDMIKDDMFSKSGFVKQDPKYQTLPASTKYIGSSKDNDLVSKGVLQKEVNNNNSDLKSIESGNITGGVASEKKIPSLISSHFDSRRGRSGVPGSKLVIDTQTTTLNRPVPPGSIANGSSSSLPVQGTAASVHSVHTSRAQEGNASDRPFISVTGKPGLGIWPPPAAKETEQQPQINIFDEERQAGSGQSSPASSEGAAPQTPVVKSIISAFSEDSALPGSLDAPKTVAGSNRAIPGAGQAGTQQAERSGNVMKLGQLFEAREVNSAGKPRPKPPPRNPQHSGPVKTLSPEQVVRENGWPAAPGSFQGLLISQVDEPDSSRLVSNLLSPGSPQASSTPVSQQASGSISNSNGSGSIAAGGKGESEKLEQSPNSTTTTIHLNQRPAPTYRYAPKSVIANTYMGRLGSAALERYQQNLSLLYKKADGTDKSSQPPQQQPQESKGEQQTDSNQLLPSTLEAGAVPSAMTHFGLVGSPSYPDIASDKGSYKANTPKHIRRRHSDSENEDLNKLLNRSEKHLPSELENVEEDVSDISKPNGMENKITVNVDKGILQAPASESKESLTKRLGSNGSVDDSSKGIPPSPGKPQAPPAGLDGREPVVRRRKTILKGSNSRKSANRVSFDPLALLLDASLEGELDLVMRTAREVPDVSAPNDEGITALHNAICAGHYEIMKFLVEFGCDVNSPDTDGWTPLHCAASCNNLPMVRFLVEHGACIFAATLSDNETAAEKCDEDEDGYDGCSDYLYTIQEKMGILNNGEVYAVFDYDAQNSDELEFRIGDKMIILRKGDETEKEWWWAQRKGREGYVPRNLLGLYPRISPGIRRPADSSDC